MMGIFMLVMVWEISRCGMRSKLMEAMVSCINHKNSKTTRLVTHYTRTLTVKFDQYYTIEKTCNFRLVKILSTGQSILSEMICHWSNPTGKTR